MNTFLPLLSRTLIGVILLCGVGHILTAQTLPKDIYQLVDVAGLEYVPPGDAYNYFPGKDYSFFDYDFKLSNGRTEVLVKINLPSDSQGAHIELARIIQNLAVEPDHTSISVQAHFDGSSSLWQASWLMQSYFRPRQFFKRSFGRLVSFYTDRGAVVTMAYLFNEDLTDDVILRNRKYGATNY